MDILNSVWFLGMLRKSGHTPRQRLLCMFDILADWIEAPTMRNTLAADQVYPHPAHALERFLTQEARALNAALPELLAQQLYFMALTALREEFANPHCGSLQHARAAAEALLKAQKQQPLNISRQFAFGMAASLIASLAIGVIYLSSPHPHKADAKTATIESKLASTPVSDVASPSQTAELFASLEQMRRGECYFPEALQLPDSEKTVYIENVVGGQMTVNAQEQALMRKLMKKVRCNYTPALMANSVG